MRRQILVVAFLAALVAPALLAVGGRSGPAAAPVQGLADAEAAPAYEARRVRFVSHSEADDAGAPFGGGPASGEASPAGKPILFRAAITYDSLAIEASPDADADADGAPPVVFTFVMGRDAEPEAALEPLPSDSLVAFAQSSLAALGAAVYIQAPASFTLGPGSGAPESAAVDAPLPTWLVAIAWSVFLASLGILFARSLGPAAFALYARLTLGKVANHPRRSLILHAVKAHPGANLDEVRRATGIAGGALRHHLDQLSARGLVREVPAGRETRWFEPGGKISPIETVPKGARRVLLSLDGTNALTTPEVARRLRISVQSAWKHLVRLVDAGLVRSSPVGKARTWTPILTRAVPTAATA